MYTISYTYDSVIDGPLEYTFRCGSYREVLHEILDRDLLSAPKVSNLRILQLIPTPQLTVVHCGTSGLHAPHQYITEPNTFTPALCHCGGVS